VGVFAPQQKTATLEKEQLGASGALYSTLETPKFIATKKTLLVAEFAGAYCCILAFLGENWPTAPVCTYVVHTLYIRCTCQKLGKSNLDVQFYAVSP
jgi:hypothetical protein